jgi:hypothetical protein
VPFMNSTTGADATAFSIACRVWSDNRRCWNAVRKGVGRRRDCRATTGRAACRRLCRKSEISLVCSSNSRVFGTKWYLQPRIQFWKTWWRKCRLKRGFCLEALSDGGVLFSLELSDF